MIVPHVPCDDPVRCQRCGHVAERGHLAGPPYARQSLRGIHHLAPGDCEPDEYVTVCPDCGAQDPFDDAVTCAECSSYPCICTPLGR